MKNAKTTAGKTALQLTLLMQMAEARYNSQFVNPQGDNATHNFTSHFCSDDALATKAFHLFNRLDRFLQEWNLEGINLNECTVEFSNNSPKGGTLYDSFQIMDAKGNILFWASHSVGFEGVTKETRSQIYNATTKELWQGESLTGMYKNLPEAVKVKEAPYSVNQTAEEINAERQAAEEAAAKAKAEAKEAREKARAEAKAKKEAEAKKAAEAKAKAKAARQKAQAAAAKAEEAKAEEAKA